MTKKTDKSKAIQTESFLKLQPKIIPKNQSQSNALQNLESKIPYNVLVGCAGTGKTLMATVFAIKKFLNKEYKKIVITRPAVSVDEEHGFLPGSLSEKMSPWMLPILDIFLEFFDEEKLKELIQENTIEIAPLAYMRGRNLGSINLEGQQDKRGFIIIADEMQNSTPEQMKMLLTRIGYNSKMIITGDPDQHDRGLEHNGLIDLIDRIHSTRKLKHLTIDYFSAENVVRSEAVKEILKLYPKK